MQFNPMLKSIQTCFLMSVFAMWNFFLFWGFTPAVWADTAEFAQVIRFTSSPNPVGSGARALGMGGAFIAICDDATAASWNPAGLVQLEKPELSVVYDYHKNDVSSHYEAFPDASVSAGGEDYSFNYLSAAYPFTLFSRNMTASINYQHLYDFKNNSSRNLSEIKSSLVGESIHTDDSNYDLDGELWAISPAIAIQITPTLSVGVTLNFWEDALFDNEWETRYTLRQQDMINGNVYDFKKTDYSEAYAFSGINFHLGALWSVNSRITIGAVFKSPFTADLDYRYRSFQEIPNSFPPGSPENPGGETIPTSLDISANESLDMPMSLGLGIAYRYSDALSLSMDLYRTWWEDYLLHPHNGEAISPISGKIESLSDIGNTTQVRIGGEYLIIKEKFIVPLRCGLFYDPEPTDGGIIDFWGASVGSGIVLKRIAFDMAFQYRTGDDVTIAFAGEELVQNRDTYTLYGSLIYYF